MHRFRRLMVALSRTDADPGLLRYAATIARLGTAAEVNFAHVAPTDPATEIPGLREKIEADVRAHFTDVPNTVTLSFDVVEGPLFDGLIGHIAAKVPDLLFLGHRRSHPGRWATARRLAMKVACSIWMVPEGSPPTLDRILVPTDFSAPSADALRVGASLTKLAGRAECLALHVYFNEARTTFEEYDRILRGQEHEAFRLFVTPLDLQGVRVTPLLEEGVNPAHVINRVVDRLGCDLVVMATRGRSRSAAIFLGSVTEETIVDTRVPLLVVKHYGAQMGIFRALLEKGFNQRTTQFG
jgi:nucleotide-binding universal stress UspA family protein